MSKDSLGRFLHRAVCVKGLELLLDSHQRVCKLAIVEDDDGLLDPLQKIRRQRFIFLNHLLRLNGVIEHLMTKLDINLCSDVIPHTHSHTERRNTRVTYLSDTLALHLQSLHLGEIMVVCDDVSDDRLLIGMVNADICEQDQMLMEYF